MEIKISYCAEYFIPLWGLSHDRKITHSFKRACSLRVKGRVTTTIQSKLLGTLGPKWNSSVHKMKISASIIHHTLILDFTHGLYVFVFLSLHLVYIDVKLEFDFLWFENTAHVWASLRILIRVVMGNFMREQHTSAERQTRTNWNQINKHYLHYNSFADCLCPLRAIICKLVSDSCSSRRAESDTPGVLKVYFSGFHRYGARFHRIQKQLDNTLSLPSLPFTPIPPRVCQNSKRYSRFTEAGIA